jgi:foldase protein PrsA
MTLLLLVVTASLLVGCSSKPGDTVLATVGDYDITVAEMDDYSRDLSFDNATFDQELAGKRQILDTLIYKRLLIQGAYEKGVQNIEEVSRAVLNSRNQFLNDILYQEKVSSKLNITPKELRDFWEKLAEVIHTQQIVLSTKDSAEMILGRLQAGENFEQLAYDYSIDPNVKRTRGDMGFIQWGALSSELQNAVFSMKVGEVSPPLKSSIGFYHILRVLEKRPNSSRRQPEEMKEELYGSVFNRKAGELMEAYFREMRATYKLTIDTATIQYLLVKRSNMYPPQILASLPKSTFDMTQLDRNEKELKMASWTGGQVSVSEYFTLADESGVPPQYRPDLDQYDSLASFMFDIKRNDFLVTEALKLGLDKHPDFLRRIKFMKELTMAEVMSNDSLTVGLEVTDQMAREFYEKNARMFTRPERIRVYEILTSDQSLAARLAREIKSLPDFSAKAIQYTERDTKRGTNGDLNYIESRTMPDLFAAAQQTAIGEIGGPIPNEGKFSVFYVVDKLPQETIDYLGVKRDIVTQLVDTVRNQTARNWIAEQRAKKKIEVFEENVRKAVLDRRTKYEAARAI